MMRFCISNKYKKRDFQGNGGCEVILVAKTECMVDLVPTGRSSSLSLNGPKESIESIESNRAGMK